MDIVDGTREPRLRPAVIADLDAIAALESGEFHALAYPYFVLRQLFDIHGSHWVVADADGSMCGYALVAVGARRTAWLIGLAVSPDFRGLGIGRLLIERAVTRCRSAQIDAVYITVRPTNTPAANLYKTTGFVWVGYEDHYFGSGEPRDLLVRLIDHPGENWADADPADRRWTKRRGRSPLDRGTHDRTDLDPPTG